MKKNKSYYKAYEFNMHKFENIEDKNTIHQFENKNINLDTESLKEKYTLNEIR